jgi:hypothetical protein
LLLPYAVDTNVQVHPRVCLHRRIAQLQSKRRSLAGTGIERAPSISPVALPRTVVKQPTPESHCTFQIFTTHDRVSEGGHAPFLHPGRSPAHKDSMARPWEGAVAGVRSGLISLGEQITWRAWHFGVPIRMMKPDHPDGGAGLLRG